MSEFYPYMPTLDIDIDISLGSFHATHDKAWKAKGEVNEGLSPEAITWLRERGLV